MKGDEIEQFFCEGCKLWLTQGGPTHNDGEHEGAPPTERRRYSYDDGETWQDEPRVQYTDHDGSTFFGRIE